MYPKILYLTLYHLWLPYILLSYAVRFIFCFNLLKPLQEAGKGTKVNDEYYIRRLNLEGGNC